MRLLMVNKMCRKPSFRSSFLLSGRSPDWQLLPHGTLGATTHTATGGNENRGHGPGKGSQRESLF